MWYYWPIRKHGWMHCMNASMIYMIYMISHLTRWSNWIRVFLSFLLSSGTKPSRSFLGDFIIENGLIIFIVYWFLSILTLLLLLLLSFYERSLSPSSLLYSNLWHKTIHSYSRENLWIFSSLFTRSLFHSLPPLLCYFLHSLLSLLRSC